MADISQRIEQTMQHIDSMIHQEEKSQSETKPLPLQSAAAGKVNNEEKKGPKPFVDPFLLAYYDLLNLTNATSKSALIQSKELQGNARAQQRLDNLDAKLPWYNVPKLIIKHEVHTIRKKEYTDPFTHSGKVVYYKTKRVKVTIRVNGGAVDQAEAKNQMVLSERQTISNKLAVLQQIADVGETNVNTLVQVSMQTDQEDSGLISLLEDLTFKALLRKPPQ